MKYQSFSEFRKAKIKEIRLEISQIAYYTDEGWYVPDKVDVFDIIERHLLEAAQAGIEAGKVEKDNRLTVRDEIDNASATARNNAISESEKQSNEWLNPTNTNERN